MKKEEGILVFFILLMTVANVSADGNITTTNGNLYYISQGDHIFWTPQAASPGKFFDVWTENITNSQTPAFRMGYHPYWRGGMAGVFGEKCIQDGYSDVNNRQSLWFLVDGEGDNRSMIFSYWGNNFQNSELFLGDAQGRVRIGKYGTYYDNAVVFDSTGSQLVLQCAVNKDCDLGTTTNSWDDCYCDDFITTSRGYPESAQKAYSAVTGMATGSDGEIVHSSVDPSLADTKADSVSMNAVAFANSKAIGYVMENLTSRINSLEGRVSQLEKELKTCKTG